MIFFSACSEDPIIEDCPPQAPTTTALKVLPLGDSRVEGARPNFESYRYELWKIFIENGQEIDFLGSRKDQVSYERVQGFCFDGDHEGTGGATTLDILQTLDEIHLDQVPEVVLLGIGGNDLLDGGRPVPAVLASIDQIINRLQNDYPGVTIYLEQIAPIRSDLSTSTISEALRQFNSGIAALGAEYEKVTVVDMTTNWNDNLLADEVHYNEAGARVVAQRYYAALNE